MKTGPASSSAKNCCDGKVVKITNDELTATSDKGDEQHYTVDRDTKVTCDGKESRLSDLKKGATIRMTMCKDDETKLIAVDCGKHIPALATN